MLQFLPLIYNFPHQRICNFRALSGWTEKRLCDDMFFRLYKIKTIIFQDGPYAQLIEDSETRIDRAKQELHLSKAHRPLRDRNRNTYKLISGMTLTSKWEQWYYNNGFQDVVISIHFVNIKPIFFTKLPGFEPTPTGPSLVFRFVL